MSPVVNGVRADFITSSRLHSLNKHLPVTSFTGAGTEWSGQAGRRQESDGQQSRWTMKYLSVKVGWVLKSAFSAVETRHIKHFS